MSQQQSGRHVRASDLFFLIVRHIGISFRAINPINCLTARFVASIDAALSIRQALRGKKRAPIKSSTRP